MKKNNRKGRQGVVYSTDENFSYSFDNMPEQETLPPAKQQLRISLDKKARAGKQVTLISGFTGTKDDLESLGKNLKISCGTGGSVKEGEIVLQGDFRDLVAKWLSSKGYNVKRSG